MRNDLSAFTIILATLWSDEYTYIHTYIHTRVASELVDWFVSSGEAESREQAVEFGQLLINTDYIHHVVDEHNFEDAYLFFRFRQDGKVNHMKCYH